MFVQVAILLAFAAVALGQAGLGLQQIGQGYGNAYGGQGHLNQAVGDYGHGHNAGQSVYNNQAYGNQGHHGGGLAQHHGSQGGNQALNDVHHNSGVYARNKGHGYEKVFAYDKIYSNQVNGGQRNAHGGYFNTNGALQAQQQGGHGNFGQSAFGSEGHQAGYGQGHQELLNKGYGNYGQNSGQGQRLIELDGYGHGK